MHGLSVILVYVNIFFSKENNLLAYAIFSTKNKTLLLILQKY